ncbi:MAG: NAD-dependent deacylase [Pseudomonadota bacterium]
MSQTTQAALPASVVVLTGAGLSAESGLGTFRDVDGIWTKYDLEDVATPKGFARNPQLVLYFYNARRENAMAAEPNAAHRALARLQNEAQARGATVQVVTQNVDTLHEAAGTADPIHMHGSLARTLCNACGARAAWDTPLTTKDVCGACGRRGTVRPDVVWFGEVPYEMERILSLLVQADLFLSIGTSGTVYPAAGFVQIAKEAGAVAVELNLEPSEGASLFDEQINGPASAIVPAFVDRLLGAA